MLTRDEVRDRLNEEWAAERARRSTRTTNDIHIDACLAMIREAVAEAERERLEETIALEKFHRGTAASALKAAQEARAEAERLRERAEALARDLSNAHHETRKKEGEIVKPKHLRAAPPTVCTVDVEKAAHEIERFTDSLGEDSHMTVDAVRDEIEEIIRKHARHISVEAVAEAIRNADVGDYCRHFARAALREIGARLQENSTPGQRDSGLSGEGDDPSTTGARWEHTAPAARSTASKEGCAVPVATPEPPASAQPGGMPLSQPGTSNQGIRDGLQATENDSGGRNTPLARAMDHAAPWSEGAADNGDASARLAQEEAVARRTEAHVGSSPQAGAPTTWTEEQREAAWAMHLETRGYIRRWAYAEEAVCNAIARVAPRFVRVRLPDVPVHSKAESVFAAMRQYREGAIQALRSQGVEFERAALIAKEEA